MKLTYSISRARFEAICAYEDRQIPKEAGFRWDGRPINVWSAPDIDTARKFEHLADAKARAAFDVGHEAAKVIHEADAAAAEQEMARARAEAKQTQLAAFMGGYQAAWDNPEETLKLFIGAGLLPDARRLEILAADHANGRFIAIQREGISSRAGWLISVDPKTAEIKVKSSGMISCVRKADKAVAAGEDPFYLPDIQMHAPWAGRTIEAIPDPGEIEAIRASEPTHRL